MPSEVPIERLKDITNMDQIRTQLKGMKLGAEFDGTA
jgi:hypothetical protein